MKLVVVHFQPLEGYPPAMNVIQSLVDERFSFSVITTGSQNSWFKLSEIQIFRLGSYHGGRLKRYLCYLHFNFLGLIQLIIENPKAVLCYETSSIGPVYLYKLFRPRTKIFLHFHEYESEIEKNSGSVYQKILHNFADKLLADIHWLSHTNSDRLEKYKTDYRGFALQNLNIFPNYPSALWAEDIEVNSAMRDNGKLKLVYVGSLGLRTTFIAEMIEWVEAQFGKVELTIFSQNIENSVIGLINTSSPAYIQIKPSITYFDLPVVLSQFDAGLVLYNGHSPNYIYNIPNKVNEYLACGLNVWYSDGLVSTTTFAKENPDYPIFAVDFSKGNQMETPTISRDPFEYRHYHEDVVKPLIQAFRSALTTI